MEGREKRKVSLLFRWCAGKGAGAVHFSADATEVVARNNSSAVKAIRKQDSEAGRSVRSTVHCSPNHRVGPAGHVEARMSVAC